MKKELKGSKSGVEGQGEETEGVRQQWLCEGRIRLSFHVVKKWLNNK